MTTLNYTDLLAINISTLNSYKNVSYYLFYLFLALQYFVSAAYRAREIKNFLRAPVIFTTTYLYRYLGTAMRETEFSCVIIHSVAF